MQEGASNNKKKTPPASQHRGVMPLCQSIPLYDMRLRIFYSLREIIKSSRDANKVMTVLTVTTNRLSQVQQDPKYLWNC
jgi:hypothetical protein